MTFDQLMMLLVTLVGSLSLIIFNRIAKDLNKLTDSVARLNVNVAVVIEKMEGHEQRIRRLERSGHK